LSSSFFFAGFFCVLGVLVDVVAADLGAAGGVPEGFLLLLLLLLLEEVVELVFFFLSSESEIT